MTDDSVLSTILDRRQVMQGGAALLATAAVARSVPALDAAKEEATKLGYEIVQSFSGSAPEKQLAELNAWIASGVDALVVLPLDANAIGGVVKKCHDKGILFVGYANNVPGNDGY